MSYPVYLNPAVNQWCNPYLPTVEQVVVEQEKFLPALRQGELAAERLEFINSLMIASFLCSHDPRMENYSREWILHLDDSSLCHLLIALRRHPKGTDEVTAFVKENFDDQRCNALMDCAVIERKLETTPERENLKQLIFQVFLERIDF
ncbi:MAG: hypothetical protein WC371_02510 [Parachlamydiales bacterium]|jgi:hypothetical protein